MSGEQDTFQFVKDTFVEGKQSETELLDILREVIRDVCIHRNDFNDIETEGFLYSIWDEFNHDPKVDNVQYVSKPLPMNYDGTDVPN